jgi:hypothetical protein
VVPFGESAALDAFVTDDGDPPGTLMTSWSWLDGPGAVTFAEPQAVSTTAAFDAPGVYSLRATASDGQLSRSDELSVDVRADAPLLAIDDIFASEGDPATFTVSLLEGDASPVSVDWSSVEGTAIAGVDYQVASGTLALSGAAPSQTLSVPVIDDGSHEESETFSVRLTNPVGAEILKAEGVAVVLDDDPALQQLSVGVEGGGGVLLAPPGGVYEQGTVVTLTAEAAPGFGFAGWSGHLAGSANPASIQMEADRAVTAHFTTLETFTLGVTAVGSGAVALDPPGGVYPSGTVVTLSATPDPGSAFVGWGGALAGSASPATLLMGSHRVVTASFEPVGASVALREVATGGASLSFVVATSTSLAAASGDLYLAAVAFRPHGSVTGVSGLGLGWTQLAAQCGARSQTGLSLWKAQGAPSGSGIVSATFSTAPLNTVIAVARYSGVSLSGALGGAVPANQLGIAGACQGGVDASSYAFPLTTTAADSLVFAATAMRTRTHSPGAGYSERAEVRAGSGGDVASIALEDGTVAAPSAATVNGAFSGTADWASLAVEIRRATGAPAP